jgi:hypothetical protein
MSDIWLTQTAAQVAVQRSLTATPTATVRHGTIVAVDYGTFIHELQLDEPGNVTIRAHDVTDVGVGIGDRVTVLFAPPHQALIIGSPVHDHWHLIGTNREIVFTPGWGNNSLSGALDSGTYPQVMYRRDGTLVHLRGSAENFSSGTNIIFIMPEGYRPRNDLLLPALTSFAGHSVVQINRDGAVISQAGSTPLHFHNVTYSIL